MTKADNKWDLIINKFDGVVTNFARDVDNHFTEMNAEDDEGLKFAKRNETTKDIP